MHEVSSAEITQLFIFLTSLLLAGNLYFAKRFVDRVDKIDTTLKTFQICLVMCMKELKIPIPEELLK